MFIFDLNLFIAEMKGWRRRRRRRGEEEQGDVIRFLLLFVS